MAGTEYSTVTVTVGISFSQDSKIDVDSLEERITEALSRRWEVKYVEREPGYLDEDYDPAYEDTVEIFACVAASAKRYVNEFGEKETETDVSRDEIGSVLEENGITHDYVSFVDYHWDGDYPYILCA